MRWAQAPQVMPSTTSTVVAAGASTGAAAGAVVAASVVAMSMVPAVQFPHWQWLALGLTVPVVAWGAWPFHRAALGNLRRGFASMDTLVSMGTLAALAWSVYALLVGHGTHIYLEVAAGITALVLAGRFAEARARRRSGAVLRQRDRKSVV